mmetsp:Transcript_31448/g.103790  ORF Transcript_31448/g.103790 Transcript_31448/m.103790 type:complete len:367 (+) Transcript_31448:313-1413(+)
MVTEVVDSLAIIEPAAGQSWVERVEPPHHPVELAHDSLAPAARERALRPCCRREGGRRRRSRPRRTPRDLEQRVVRGPGEGEGAVLAVDHVAARRVVGDVVPRRRHAEADGGLCGVREPLHVHLDLVSSNGSLHLTVELFARHAAQPRDAEAKRARRVAGIPLSARGAAVPHRPARQRLRLAHAMLRHQQQQLAVVLLHRLLRPLGVLGVREPVRAVQQLRVAQNLLAPPRREQVLQQVGRAVVHLAEHGRGLVAAVGAPLHPVRVQGRLERARQRHKPAVLGRVDCSGCHLGKPQADRVVRADQRPARRAPHPGVRQRAVSSRLVRVGDPAQVLLALVPYEPLDLLLRAHSRSRVLQPPRLTDSP